MLAPEQYEVSEDRCDTLHKSVVEEIVELISLKSLDAGDMFCIILKLIDVMGNDDNNEAGYIDTVRAFGMCLAKRYVLAVQAQEESN